ncbi:hypothetical protein MCOR25_005263 [Pyricularia grisea]|uniref:Rhodopsin domain-containing protein n=1 Tax=Pyricularia grisea TaxID=148305 RepID=A0A6P8AS80_PYRGI|nr:uncharacterized protein PgNI_09246 [Pyricularia grisea]KAI6365774.1 hypothetical protein MCOR25_005263 [Pyricularia grisea]TLD04984.1 hypothetical protein PgNI_09246 [Pyricularia grisea]
MATASGPATYFYNDTSLPEAQRQYLKGLADAAAIQNLDEDVRNYVRAITIAFTVLATIVVGMRLWARQLQAAKIMIDDYAMLAALALLYGNMIINLVLVDYGIGLHSGRLPYESIELINRTLVGAELLYVTTINQYKIALLLLYLRIFPMAQVRKGAMWCGALTLGWMLACWIAACLQCIPLVKAWNPWVQGQCINLFLTQLCISIPSIIVDIAILALPIPHVLKLQLSPWQKYLVMGTFLLGSYVVFTSCYRFRIFLDYTTSDVPYSIADGIAWNIIELSSGIVSACLPTLGPIVRLGIKAFGSVADATGLSSYAKSSSRTGNGTSSDPHASGRSRGKSWSKLGDAGASRNNDSKGPLQTIGSQPVRQGQPRDSDSEMELHIMRDVAAPSQVAYRR